MRGNNDDGTLLVCDRDEKLGNHSRRHLIEHPGRLIGQHEGWRCCEGPGDADALNLATGELFRMSSGAMRKAEFFQQLMRALFRARPLPTEEPERKHNVLDCREFRQEFTELEDQTDAGEAKSSAPILAETPNLCPIDHDAAARRSSNAAQTLQEGCLP